MANEFAKTAAAQAAAVGVGVAVGAYTHRAASATSRGPSAGEVGQAMAAAAVNGATVSGTVAAGTAVVAAKVGVIATVATRAAPVIGVGAAAYGLYRLLDKNNARYYNPPWVD